MNKTSSEVGASPLVAGHFSFVRGLSLSDFMTLANGIGGAGAVLAVLGYMADGRFAWLALALALHPLCLAMDFFDGHVARARGKASALGADLDLLADVVSFGVAPAAIGFAVGLRGGWDVMALLFLVACAIGRLARYNVTSAALSDDAGKVRYFEGIPVTGSLLIVAALAASVRPATWARSCRSARTSWGRLSCTRWRSPTLPSAAAWSASGCASRSHERHRRPALVRWGPAGDRHARAAHLRRHWLHGRAYCAPGGGGGLRPILAARQAAAVAGLAGELGLAHRAFALDRADAIDLSGVAVVLSCAGPFSETAGPLVDACLRARAHYLDITGEVAVFEAWPRATRKRSQRASCCCPAWASTWCRPTAWPPTSRRAFRRRPSSARVHRAGGCRGAPRSHRSPGPSAGGWFAGTARWCVCRSPTGRLRVDFGSGARVPAVAIPWGDVFTALRHHPHPEHRGLRGAAPVDAGGARCQPVARTARQQRAGAAPRREVGARPRERAVRARAGRRRDPHLGRGARRGGRRRSPGCVRPSRTS